MNTRHTPHWFWLTLPAVFLAALTTGETATTQSTATANVKTVEGLTVVTFKVDSGTIKVNLPDDMAAGDTISGTVIAEPNGNTAEDRAKSRGLLNAFVVEIGDKPIEPFNVTCKENDSVMPCPATFFLYHADEKRLNAPVVLKTREGTEAARIVLPVFVINPRLSVITGNKSATGTTTRTTDPAPRPRTLRYIGTNVFELPTIGQRGRQVEITGPFDGNSSNTTLNFKEIGSTVRDFEKGTENVSGGFGLIRPLAESPRKAVFESLPNVTGPAEIVLKEANVEKQSTYRNVGVRLSAPTTNLRRGEQTTLTVEVQGLQGIKNPVPLTLESQGVITMDGGNFQPLFIQPTEVSSDGRYTTTRNITGLEPGGWTATATVVTQPFNIVLRDPNPPQTLLLNSFTGDYVFCGAGSKLSGTGQIKRQGCVLTLTDNRVDRRINGTLDSCTPVDNGRFFVFYSAGTNTDIIVNVTDTKPTRTKIYFNPLGKPAPPVQDVSAFATCP